MKCRCGRRCVCAALVVAVLVVWLGALLFSVRLGGLRKPRVVQQASSQHRNIVDVVLPQPLRGKFDTILETLKRHQVGTDVVNDILDLCDEQSGNVEEAATTEHPTTISSASMSRHIIGQLNTFEGFPGTLRRRWFRSWVQRAGISVLGLNELCNWDAKLLSEASREWGFSNSAFLHTQSGFHIGIVSTLPMEKIGTYTSHPFTHGALHVRVQHDRNFHVHYIATHLTPYDAARRLLEAEQLVEITKLTRLKYSRLGRLRIRGWAGGDLVLGVELQDGENARWEDLLQQSASEWGVSPSEMCGVLERQMFLGPRLRILLKDVVRCSTERSPVLQLFNSAPACAAAQAAYAAATPAATSECPETEIPEPIVILGDMNSLSPLDRPHYARSRLAQHIQALVQSPVSKAVGERLARKFLQPDGTIDYRPVQYMLSHGLHDLLGSLGRVHARLHATVPTAMQQDFMHVQPMRLDYMMLDEAAVDLVRGIDAWAASFSSPCTEILSDHLPLLASICARRDGCTADSMTYQPPCTLQALCEWKRLKVQEAVALKHEMQELRHHNSRRWRREEASHGSWQPVPAQKRGQSCDIVCADSGLVCNAAAFPLINKCDRMRAMFPCLKTACRAMEGLDMPTFDGKLSDRNGYKLGNRCLVAPDDNSLNCHGSHPKTYRLCPCSQAAQDVHYVASETGETCEETCQRQEKPDNGALKCTESRAAFVAINSCDHLLKHITSCHKCESMPPDIGATPVLPGSLPNLGICMVGTIGTSSKHDPSGQLCKKSFPHIRLCPCVPQ